MIFDSNPLKMAAPVESTIVKSVLLLSTEELEVILIELPSVFKSMSYDMKL